MKYSYKETFRLTTTRPVAILMIVVAVFVFGIISYYRLSLNLMPDITYPSLTVRTEYPGAAPEEVETIISRPVEQALGVVNNLVNISSISKAGYSDVILEFTWDTDMNLATQDCREKVDQVFLPPDVKRPIILRYDPTLDPIMRLGLYADAGQGDEPGALNLFALRRIADEELRRDLETLPGIAAVKIKGGLEEEIRVEMNENQLTVLNISIGEINQQLAQENINLAGGNLKEGDTEYLVRTLNQFQTLDEISDVIVGIRNGAPIRVKDIGRVFKTNKEREVITRVNGTESVSIEIYKEADANIVSVAELVTNRIFGTPQQQKYAALLESGKAPPVTDPQKTRQLTSYLARTLPESVHIQTLSDQSVFIRRSIDEVLTTAVMGGILAVIVLYFFLGNLLSTLIIGLTIPVSVIATFAPMYMFGVSLNIMSLGGLALGIGMLVDNSIVVLESIFRCREEGDSITESAVRGTGEVGSAVIASTLTTIAVFFPIVFVEGIAGQIFGDMSLVVVFSLLASLLSALFFIPMLASRRLPAGESPFSVEAVRFLRFAAYENLREKLGTLRSETTPGHILDLLISLPKNLARIVMDIVLKMVQSVFTMVLVSLEFVITIFRGGKRILTAPFSARTGDPEPAGDGGNVLPAVWGPLYWHGLMKYASYATLSERYGMFCRTTKKQRPSVKRLFSGVLFPFGALYFFLSFILESVVFLVQKLSIILIMTIIALFFSITLFAGLFIVVVLFPLIGLFNKTYAFVNNVYPLMVRASLRNKGAVLAAAAGMFALCIFYLLPGLGRELIPELHQGEFTIETIYPVGTPLAETAENILPLERYMQNLPGVERVSSMSGTELASTTSLSEEGEHTAQITVSIEGGGDLADKEERLMSAARTKLSGLSGVTTKLSRPALFSFKTPVEVEIQGYNLETLQRVSSEVVSRLSRIPGLTDVKSNIRRGNPEIQIHYDRTQLAKNNLNIYQVATLVKNKVKGEVATKFRDRERNIDVLVRVRDIDKANLTDLTRMVINPGNPTPIPLSAVANISINEGPSEIRRINQQRSALVTANLTGIDLGSITNRIDRTLKSIQKPADFTFSITGQNKEMQTSLNSLQFALILAIFLIYVVMASQFESIVQPFIILFTIPLAIIGVIVTLYALKISISIVVFIGMIILAGIVVNNAIVLVDYINQLRRRGMKKKEAIVMAGQVRLRPILMTTTTTVLGLLPMALGLGEGAEIRTPMAITVIAGLVSATFLTLVVIPTVYDLIERTE